VVFLNALPVNAFPRKLATLHLEPACMDTLTEWIQLKLKEGCGLVHYIRHPATVQLLRQHGIPLPEAPSAELYRWQPGDVLVVVTLKAPQRGTDVTELKPSDLDVRIVHVEV